MLSETWRRRYWRACGLVAIVLLSGCSSVENFELEQLAKTDIDMVADTNVEAVADLLDELATKLYRRNPRELAKVQGETLTSRRAQWLSAVASDVQFEELENKRSTQAMLLAFDPEYKGDRVFALVVGLSTMLDDAYDNQQDFYMTSTLDQQKLYNSARNIEILVWRLNQRRDEQGNLFLLTNSMQPINLSFERLFGKLIARQDMMASLVAQKTNRTINRVVQGLATMTFLPI